MAFLLLHNYTDFIDLSSINNIEKEKDIINQIFYIISNNMLKN